MKRTPAWVGVLALGGFVLFHEAAFGQTMTVDPIAVTLADGARSAAISLGNPGTQPIPIQARPFLWSQVDGEDVLTPTQDVIVSPPLATIPSGQTQVLRLLVRHPTANAEATYRILIDELPRPGSDVAGKGVVHVVFRLSIPLFSEPQSSISPNLSWRVVTSGSHAMLEVTNSGNAHSRFFNPSLTTASGVPVKIAQDGTPYVLADSMRRWQLRTAGSLAAGGMTLHATISGPQDVSRVLAPVTETP